MKRKVGRVGEGHAYHAVKQEGSTNDMPTRGHHLDIDRLRGRTRIGLNRVGRLNGR